MFIHVGLLTILALPVLLVALQTEPQLLVGNESGRRLLLGLGALSAVGGSACALVASHSRRAVAWLAIANLGCLTIGLAMTNSPGVASVLLGALNHILSIALIALGLALLELQIPGRREQAGAMRERPLAAVAFLLGVLLLLGVPPLSGFVPRLLLLNSVMGQGWLVGVLVMVTVVLSGIAAVRLLSHMLLQPRDTPTTRSLFSDDLDRLTVVTVPYAPRIVLILIVVLGIISVGLGLWPQPIVSQLDAITRGFPFLSQ